MRTIIIKMDRINVCIFVSIVNNRILFVEKNENKH